MRSSRPGTTASPVRASSGPDPGGLEDGQAFRTALDLPSFRQVFAFRVVTACRRKSSQRDRRILRLHDRVISQVAVFIIVGSVKEQPMETPTPSLREQGIQALR